MQDALSLGDEHLATDDERPGLCGTQVAAAAQAVPGAAYASAGLDLVGGAVRSPNPERRRG